MAKRLFEVSPPHTVFTVLQSDATALLINAFPDPLLVSRFLQLNHALRRGVWLALSDPAKCSGLWVQRFMKALWSIVRPRLEELCTDRLLVFAHPIDVFLMPCMHSHADRMLLGRVIASHWLGGLSSYLDNDESTDDDEEGSMTESAFSRDVRWMDKVLIARQSKWDDNSVGIVHWQHNCCLIGRKLFDWHYVARALGERVDALIVQRNRDRRAQSLRPEGRWLFT